MNGLLDSVANTAEEIAYSPISQNNESSCLTHPLEDSEGLTALLNLVDAPEAENVDAELKHLKGAAGYLVKFQPSWPRFTPVENVQASFKSLTLRVLIWLSSE